MSLPLGGWPAQIRASRVGLRAIRSGDADPDWLSDAERALLGADARCPLRERIDTGDAAYWIRMPGPGADGRVGALAARSDGDLVWTWLALEPARRGLGLGGAAVVALERAARRRGLERARVLAPAYNGVALYFWLRLGYRPLAGSPWPKTGAGTWMVRDRR